MLSSREGCNQGRSQHAGGRMKDQKQIRILKRESQTETREPISRRKTRWVHRQITDVKLYNETNSALDSYKTIFEII